MTDFTIQNIEDFMQELNLGNGVAYIIERDWNLVANSVEGLSSVVSTSVNQTVSFSRIDARTVAHGVISSSAQDLNEQYPGENQDI